MKATKEQQRTRRRARILIKGTAAKPRLVVNRSLKHISAQLVDDAAGKTLASAHDMKAKKGSKTERAKAVGMELAEKAKKAGVETCAFDRAGYKYHGRVKALAEGAREGGLKF